MVKTRDRPFLIWPYFYFCISKISFLISFPYRFGKNNIILSILALTDIGFLLSLILINFRHFSFDILNAYELICKLSVYLNYLFGFLSAWLVVLFSIERLVAVYWPMSLNRICTASTQKIALALITLIGGILYSFNLLSTGLQISYTGTECVPLDKWLSFAKYMTLIDIIATMALPFVLISIINILIVFKLTEVKFNKKRRNTLEISPQQKVDLTYIEMNSIGPITATEQSHLNPYSTKIVTLAKRSKSALSLTISNLGKRKRLNTKATKILLCISTAFLILNGPIAASKIYFLFKHGFLTPIKPIHDDHLSTTTSTSLEYYDEDEKHLNISDVFNLSHYKIDSVKKIQFNQEQINRENLSFSSANNKTNSGDDNMNYIEKFAGLLTSNLYYLNFVLNFFFYSLNGPKFRRLYFGLFRRRAYLTENFISHPRTNQKN